MDYLGLKGGMGSIYSNHPIGLVWFLKNSLFRQVQSLTGNSPPGPSGLVTNEAVNATLALAEAGRLEGRMLGEDVGDGTNCR